MSGAPVTPTSIYITVARIAVSVGRWAAELAVDSAVELVVLVADSAVELVVVMVAVLVVDSAAE